MLMRRNEDVMNIKQLQRNWDEFGSQDPWWSILTFALGGGKQEGRSEHAAHTAS